MAGKNAAEVLCAVCLKPIGHGEGRYSRQDREYHPNCYDRERMKDRTEAEQRGDAADRER